MKTSVLHNPYRYQALLALFLALTVHAQNTGFANGSTGNPVGHNDLMLLKPAAGNRYLTLPDGSPFFWLGDAAWSLIAQLDREDVDFYLDDRKNKGFTVVLVNLIEHKFCTNAPSDFYGDLPFNGKPFGSPNEKYLEQADYIISAAAKRKIVVLLAPVYLGYDCKDEGWCKEVREASDLDLYTYGKYVGERFKKFANVVWIIGGDTDPTGVKGKILEIIRGIRENDAVHMFSAHNQPGSMAITPWQGESWLTINNVYSYDSVLYTHFKTAFRMKPAMPFYLCESAYENEHESTPRQLRSQAYQAILSGAMGHIFGNCPIWHFGAMENWCNKTDWKTELNNSGSVSMYYFQKLFRSRAWYSLIPDFDHRVIVSGFGEWGCRNYITSALTGDGNTLIAYVPSGTTFTVDLGKISGNKAICRWYNPSDGKVTESGKFRTTGLQQFSAPSDDDWVFVVDNEFLYPYDPGSFGLP